jgi:hypothetical protein
MLAKIVEIDARASGGTPSRGHLDCETHTSARHAAWGSMRVPHEVPVPKPSKKKVVSVHPLPHTPPIVTIPVGTVATPTSPTATGTPSASAQATPTSPMSTAIAGPPTNVVIPPPPAGFVAPSGRAYMGYLPSARELAAASTAMSDLAAFDDYVALLGSAAPPAASVASAIGVGIQWATMRIPAEAWETYVRAQYGLAWKEAKTLLEELKPLFLHAMAKNPALASQYQGLTGMFDATKVAADKAIATKKRNAKTKAAQAKSTATAAPQEAPVTEAPEAGAKAVTINA